jgi:hypothetical protein
MKTIWPLVGVTLVFVVAGLLIVHGAWAFWQVARDEGARRVPPRSAWDEIRGAERETPDDAPIVWPSKQPIGSATMRTFETTQGQLSISVSDHGRRVDVYDATVIVCSHGPTGRECATAAEIYELLQKAAR